MKDMPRRTVLPEFTSSRLSASAVCNPSFLFSIDSVELRQAYLRSFSIDDSKQGTAPSMENQNKTYFLFPLILAGDGSPWAEANLWLLDKLSLTATPRIATFSSIADDLAAFRRYIESNALSWLEFGTHKLRRPTYRYSASLRIAVQAAEISPSVAKRRMATAIRFYRWLKDEGLFNPSNALWVDSTRHIEWRDTRGQSSVVKVKTTDVSIKTPRADDPWDEKIVDDGHLRPLPREEQVALLMALAELGNTEMTLIHLFSYLTGARLQTILTVRIRHFSRSPSTIVGDDFGLQAGPGTGIDTKRGRAGVLHLPKWFYERLYVYINSDRARLRRSRAPGGDTDNQLVFLSQRGAPLYEPYDYHSSAQSMPTKRYAKTGQPVRQFIKEKLLPSMRKQMKSDRYQFSFHDLRATFGMNTVDAMEPEIKKGTLSCTRALDQLRQLMWHSSLSITEGYLDYRLRLAKYRAVEDEWHNRLVSLAKISFNSR